MDYELVVLDLDDTLLNSEHELENETIEVIKKLKNQGKKVTIATGRMYVSAKSFVEKLDINLPVISYNGAYVYHPVKEKMLFHKTIPQKIANEIIKKAEKAKMYINVYCGDDYYIEKRNEDVKKYEKVAGVKGKEIGKLSNNLKQDPTKILIIEMDLQKKKQYLDYFQKNYENKIEVTQSKASFIEIIANRVSKGNTLKELTRKMNVPREKIVALGDGFNDLEMIEWAGLGIAMENAPEEVREKADKIAPPHDENGAAQILKEIFSLSI